MNACPFVRPSYCCCRHDLCTKGVGHGWRTLRPDGDPSPSVGRDVSDRDVGGGQAHLDAGLVEPALNRHAIIAVGYEQVLDYHVGRRVRVHAVGVAARGWGEDPQVAGAAALGVNEMTRPKGRILQGQRLVRGRAGDGHLGAALELDQVRAGALQRPGIGVGFDHIAQGPKVPALTVYHAAASDGDVRPADGPHHGAVAAGAVRDVARAEVSGGTDAVS